MKPVTCIWSGTVGISVAFILTALSFLFLALAYMLRYMAWLFAPIHFFSGTLALILIAKYESGNGNVEARHWEWNYAIPFVLFFTSLIFAAVACLLIYLEVELIPGLFIAACIFLGAASVAYEPYWRRKTNTVHQSDVFIFISIYLMFSMLLPACFLPLRLAAWGAACFLIFLAHHIWVLKRRKLYVMLLFSVLLTLVFSTVLISAVVL